MNNVNLFRLIIKQDAIDYGKGLIYHDIVYLEITIYRFLILFITHILK